MRWQNKWGISLGQEDRSKPDTPKANQTTLLWNKYNRYHVTKTVSTQNVTISKIVKHAEPFSLRKHPFKSEEKRMFSQATSRSTLNEFSATDVSKKQTFWNSQFKLPNDNNILWSARLTSATKECNTALPTAFPAVSTCCLSLVYLLGLTLWVSERQKIFVIKSYF